MYSTDYIYNFPDRNIVNFNEWEGLLEACGLDSCGHSLNHAMPSGYENDVFMIKPYSYVDDETDEVNTVPNFLHKESGFALQWYKHPFRASYMNMDVTAEHVLKLFRECMESVKGEK